MRLADVYYIYTVYTIYIYIMLYIYIICYIYIYIICYILYIYVATGKLKQAARTVQARQENPIDFPREPYNPLDSQ